MDSATIHITFDPVTKDRVLATTLVYIQKGECTQVLDSTSSVILDNLYYRNKFMKDALSMYGNRKYL